jgi:hypothetical protein
VKVLIHINSPLTAIIARCYIESIKDQVSKIYLKFSRINDLESWFFDLRNVHTVDCFATHDLMCPENLFVIPHDYVEGARYTRHIHNGDISNVAYIEEGDLSWMGSRYHHDRRRLMGLFRICDIPVFGAFFDKLVFSRDTCYITMDYACFDFASDKKKHLVKFDEEYFGFYDRYFSGSSKVLLLGKYSYQDDIAKFLQLSKINRSDKFYIKPHPAVLSNEGLKKPLIEFLQSQDLYRHLLLSPNISLELESIFSNVEVYGSASTLERYAAVFPYSFRRLD